MAAGDPAAFTTAGHLVAFAGLVPVARDSGKRVGNHRRMSGGNKLLKRVFYQSAFASLRTSHSTPSRSASGVRAGGTTKP